MSRAFEAFYQEWLARQESLLLSVTPDGDEQQQRMWIEQVLCHYQQFLEAKSTVANHDVFLLFSPPWLSAYQTALLWIGDYKPSLIVRLVDGAVKDLTGEQREQVERVRDETKRAEREVSEAMAAVQESMASPHMVGLVRLLHPDHQTALHGLKTALTKVFHRADELRASTMMKLLQIFTTPQTVQFLLATIHFQKRLRNYSFHTDQVGPSQ
ncbi:hypothetical protein VNO78_01189 [Psophocarpus tetragonolobus]|uniref:DOG1 domain-containing protein n=1 Tax=Psophocarpus tetragonolobus TaxID=3891 RepID=A0AAN9XV26_PSOTE